MQSLIHSIRFGLRSIRFRLTLWYVSIFAAVLCTMGWVLYGHVQESMSRETDQLLILETDKAMDRVGDLLSGEKGKRKSTVPDIGEKLSGWLEKEGLPFIVPLRVQDADGRVLTSSAEFPKLLKPLGGTWRRWTFFRLQEYGGKRIRLISRPYFQNGDVAALIQAATPLAESDKALQKLRLWLLWLIMATLATTSAVGWILASLALRPIEQITTRTQQIGAQSLDQRVPVAKTGDELERLGNTVNEMLARLEGAFNGLRQFSSAASHELRTPLTVMRGELELALRRPRQNDEYQRVLRTHLETVSDMTRIVEELLLLAHTKSDEAIEWGLQDFSRIADDVIAKWQPQAATKKITCARHPWESAQVHGEERLLNRIVANLLENAIRRSPEGGRVQMSLAHKGGKISFLVQDSGEIIPPEAYQGIFDRYFRSANAGALDGFSGMGLGVCRWIAEAHHGSLDVSSSETEGTVFSLCLPAHTSRS